MEVTPLSTATAHTDFAYLLEGLDCWTGLGVLFTIHALAQLRLIRCELFSHDTFTIFGLPEMQVCYSSKHPTV